MIDTVQGFSTRFDVRDETKWTKHTTTDLGTGDTQEKLSCNISPHLNLTIFPQKHLATFHCSLPKIIYGTSLEELKESDKGKVIDTLQRKFRDECGLDVRDGLEDFTLSRVDFCKNVKVDYHPKDYIRALGQFKFSRRETAKYKNETLSFRNTRRELTFYDKVEEVSRVEKDEEILRRVSGMKHDLLRVEARLRNSSVVKKELGCVPVLSVISEDLCRKKLCREYESLVRIEGEQMDFDFEGNLKLIEEIKKRGVRDVFGKFLQYKGIGLFLAECGYDWEVVREVIEQVYPVRRTVYKVLRKLQEDQSLVLIQKDRKLIKEVHEKLRLVA